MAIHKKLNYVGRSAAPSTAPTRVYFDFPMDEGYPLESTAVEDLLSEFNIQFSPGGTSIVEETLDEGLEGGRLMGSYCKSSGGTTVDNGYLQGPLDLTSDTTLSDSGKCDQSSCFILSYWCIFYYIWHLWLLLYNRVIDSTVVTSTYSEWVTISDSCCLFTYKSSLRVG